MCFTTADPAVQDHDDPPIADRREAEPVPGDPAHEKPSDRPKKRLRDRVENVGPHSRKRDELTVVIVEVDSILAPLVPSTRRNVLICRETEFL
jgi:hypothetical protein